MRKIWLVHLLIGPLMLVFALLIWFNPPQEINEVYGYRTAASMQSQAAWNEANRFSSSLLITVAAATIIMQLLSSRLWEPKVALLASCGFLVISLLFCVLLTEVHLKQVYPRRHVAAPINSD